MCCRPHWGRINYAGVVDEDMDLESAFFDEAGLRDANQLVKTVLCRDVALGQNGCDITLRFNVFCERFCSGSRVVVDPVDQHIRTFPSQM